MARSEDERFSQAKLLVGEIPWHALLWDVVFVVAWVVVLSVAFRVGDGPTWLYYVVVFGGVIAYSTLSSVSGFPSLRSALDSDSGS